MRRRPPAVPTTPCSSGSYRDNRLTRTVATGPTLPHTQVRCCEDGEMSLRRRTAAAFLAALVLAALTGCPVEAEDADDGDDYITLSVSR